MSLYLLIDNKPVPAESPLQWGAWMQTFENRIVQKTKLGDVEISTVFLGVDHGWNSASPVLFETAVFGEGECVRSRYCTYDDAVKGHERICEEIIALQIDKIVA